MKYLALDPGLTTGVAWYDTSTEEFGSLEVRGEHGLYEYLKEDWGFLHKHAKAPDVLVYELWLPRSDSHKVTNQPEARNIGGACEAWAWQLDGLMSIYGQTPASAKKLATNEILRGLGWYSGGAGHADDAVRHLVYRLVKHDGPRGDFLQRVWTAANS